MSKPPRARANAAALVLAATIGLPLLAACVAHPHHHARPAAVRVVVAKGHAHTARCGHYRHRGHWYHLRGHVHGASCGHRLVAGVWVVRR